MCTARRKIEREHKLPTLLVRTGRVFGSPIAVCAKSYQLYFSGSCSQGYFMLSIGLICYQLYSPHTTALRLRIHSAAEHARKVIPQPEGPLCDQSGQFMAPNCGQLMVSSPEAGRVGALKTELEDQIRDLPTRSWSLRYRRLLNFGSSFTSC